MTDLSDTETDRYSAVLEGNLKDVAADLRAIDLADLVSYIRFGAYTTLEDLVQSSTELFFRPGTLSFGWTATVDLGWGEQPSVTLGMEFRHGPVSVFFDLMLQAFGEHVALCGILFETPVEEARKIDVLSRAIAGARLKPSPASDGEVVPTPPDEAR